MGIGPFASPISDDQLNDIKSKHPAMFVYLIMSSTMHPGLIETVLTTFTVQYSKAYAVALVKHIEEELKKEKPDEWKLLERPVGSHSVRFTVCMSISCFYNYVHFHACPSYFSEVGCKLGEEVATD